MMSVTCLRSGTIAGLAFAAICAAPAPAQTTHTVELAGMSFTPPDLTIQVGDTVHWAWISGFHNVESGVVVAGAGVHDGHFRSGDPNFDLTFDLTFDQAFLDSHPISGDVYPYFCIVHAGFNMVGTITVQRAAGCTRDGDCDDGDDCNGLEVCVSDDCAAGTPIVCDDGNVCDGIESCQGGACVEGPALNCNDSNPCTNDPCDPASGCQHVANDSNACTDGNPCTVDTCVNGGCISTSIPGCSSCGTDADCNDADPCTDDTCRGGTCAHTFNVSPCDDGDACTGVDACSNGACAGIPITGCCHTDADCDDGDPCTTGACANNTCMGALVENCVPCGSDGECDDGDACTDDICGVGVCLNPTNTATCDDGDPCTDGDRCSDGACAGTAVEDCCRSDGDCDDRDRCTTDKCIDNACAHQVVQGCGDDENGESVPDGDDAGDTGNVDAGAPLPDGDGMTHQPLPSSRRLCGVFGMIVLVALLLGLGVIRAARVARDKGTPVRHRQY